MFQMLQSQNYGLQQLIKLEELCAFKTMKGKNEKQLQHILSPNLKVAAT